MPSIPRAKRTYACDYGVLILIRKRRKTDAAHPRREKRTGRSPSFFSRKSSSFARSHVLGYDRKDQIVQLPPSRGKTVFVTAFHSRIENALQMRDTGEDRILLSSRTAHRMSPPVRSATHGFAYIHSFHRATSQPHKPHYSIF